MAKITEKYTQGPDKLAESVPLKHANRNTNKKRDKTVQRDEQQQEEPRHGRAEHTPHRKANAQSRGGNEQSQTREGVLSEARGEALAGKLAPEDDAMASGVPRQTGMHIMSSMDKDIFAELAGHPADVCVTIYLSTHPSGEEVNAGADKRALKNALNQARRSMEELKIENVIEDILGPAEELLQDDGFWHGQAHGLIMFLAPDTHSCCLLPYDPGNETHVHTSFILIPLAPMITYGDSYFLLVLSKHAAQIYQGYKFELIPIPVPELPKGIEDVVHFEEKDDTEPGKLEERSKTSITQYFREIDRTLREQILGISNLPLLLAGVEYELPLYREVNTYPHLIEEELTGNFDHTPMPALFAKAQKKMNAWFEDQRRKAFQNNADHGAASVTSFLQDVIRAAFEGRISRLYVAKGPLLWGQYTSRPEEAVIHEQEEDGDDCLTNQAVVQTLLHGGDAYIVDKEKMPMEGQMVAVLRY